MTLQKKLLKKIEYSRTWLFIYLFIFISKYSNAFIQNKHSCLSNDLQSSNVKCVRLKHYVIWIVIDKMSFIKEQYIESCLYFQSRGTFGQWKAISLTNQVGYRFQSTCLSRYWSELCLASCGFSFVLSIDNVRVCLIFLFCLFWRLKYFLTCYITDVINPEKMTVP